jgi:hypothetical protein
MSASNKFRFIVFTFSDAFLQFTDFLQTQSVVRNDSRLSYIELLNSTSQIEWLLGSVLGDWKNKWNTPMQMILTKWGFCFSFNLMPLVELLRVEKYFEIESTDFKSNSIHCFVEFQCLLNLSWFISGHGSRVQTHFSIRQFHGVLPQIASFFIFESSIGLTKTSQM